MGEQHDDVMKPTQEEAATSLSVEEMIESSIGRMNCAQIVQAILASIPVFFDNQQMFISVFTDGQPAWHCTNRSTTCSSTSDICSLPKSDWAWDENMHHNTIISDWGLQCASSFIKGLPATSYFVGSLLGGCALFSLGDSFLGKKNLIFISCLVMSLAAMASAFSPNVWVYLVLRFICGVGHVGITNSALVLMSERVGKRWRGQVLSLGAVSYSLGSLSMTLIAYMARGSSWRTLYLWTSIPAIICTTVAHFFLCESPRWLFMQGRQSDAIALLTRIGSINDVNFKLPAMVIGQAMNGNPFSSIKILAKKRWAVQRLLACMILGFGVGLAYFGMFLGVGGLGLNVYLITSFNAILSLVTALLSYLFWIQRCNRRSSVLGFCTISGAGSIVSGVVGYHHHKGIHTGLELISLFCACMVFYILFMYVMEIFPTCVRTSAAALSRQSLLFGSVFVPVLAVIGRRDEFISHSVYGVGILLSGVLALTLPETRGKALCDTMEE